MKDSPKQPLGNQSLNWRHIVWFLAVWLFLSVLFRGFSPGPSIHEIPYTDFKEKVGRGDDVRYKPREIRVVQEMTWNGAACDVGEFGVTQVPTVDEHLEPFNPDELHLSGMVFEPVSSFSEARQTAQEQFKDHVRGKAKLDRLSQLFLRSLRQRFGLVYHPLWVLRYLYRERAFQVTVDGFSGKVLYGKAPGNTIYRAGVLVLGMAFGAFLAITIPALILGASDGEGGFFFALGLFAAGLGIMYASYRAFRYGEQYEFRHGEKKGMPNIPGMGKNLSTSLDVKDVEEWINLLN